MKVKVSITAEGPFRSTGDCRMCDHAVDGFAAPAAAFAAGVSYALEAVDSQQPVELGLVMCEEHAGMTMTGIVMMNGHRRNAKVTTCAGAARNGCD